MGKSVAKQSEASVPLVFGDIELIEPTHFDGWTADDIEDLVVTNAAQVERREQETDAWRIGMGLGLWSLRQEVGEATFVGRLGPMADKAGVTVRTLNRWREAAEKHHNLPATKRSIGQSRTRKIGLGTVVPKAIVADSAEVPPPLPLAPCPPAPVTNPVPAPAAPPTRRPLAPSATPCHHCKGTGVEPPARSGAYVPNAKREREKCPDGKHPVSRRLGSMCGACGDPQAWGKG